MLSGYLPAGRAPLEARPAAAAPGPRRGSRRRGRLHRAAQTQQAACGSKSCRQAAAISRRSLTPSQEGPASRQGGQGQLEEAAGRQDLGAMRSGPRAHTPEESGRHGSPPAPTSWGTRHEPAPFLLQSLHLTKERGRIFHHSPPPVFVTSCLATHQTLRQPACPQRTLQGPASSPHPASPVCR